jgi:hypothetical protein
MQSSPCWLHRWPSIDCGRKPRSCHKFSGGVDLTKIPAIRDQSAHITISEVGLDMGNWKTEKQFCSFLGLLLNHLGFAAFKKWVVKGRRRRSVPRCFFRAGKARTLRLHRSAADSFSTQPSGPAAFGLLFRVARSTIMIFRAGSESNQLAFRVWQRANHANNTDHITDTFENPRRTNVSAVSSGRSRLLWRR